MANFDKLTMVYHNPLLNNYKQYTRLDHITAKKYLKVKHEFAIKINFMLEMILQK